MTDQIFCIFYILHTNWEYIGAVHGAVTQIQEYLLFSYPFAQYSIN